MRIFYWKAPGTSTEWLIVQQPDCVGFAEYYTVSAKTIGRYFKNWAKRNNPVAWTLYELTDD